MRIEDLEARRCPQEKSDSVFLKSMPSLHLDLRRRRSIGLSAPVDIFDLRTSVSSSSGGCDVVD